jgi:hypothetical protein
MEQSGQWEKITVPAKIDSSAPYLDWLLTRPSLRIETKSLPVGYVNAFFPDGPDGHPIIINQARDQPRVHLALVYIVSGAAVIGIGGATWGYVAPQTSRAEWWLEENRRTTLLRKASSYLK